MSERPAAHFYPPGYGPIGTGANLRRWETDDEFTDVWRAVRGHTLVDEARLYELWELAGEVSAVPGAYLEIGVWRGGSGAVVASRFERDATTDSPRRPFLLADTFAGVVKAGPRDAYYRGGEHANTSVDTVSALFHSLALPPPTLLVGIFPDETADRVPPGPIALCHIDVDVYRSAKECYEWVWPRLSPGGIVVFDDYGFLGCEGVTEYVQELRCTPGRTVIANLNGHAIVVKGTQEDDR